MDEEKLGKILAVCANGDRKDNRQVTNRIIYSLLDKKYIPDIPYEFISVNPDDMKGDIVYDNHILGYFGTEEFNIPEESCDVIIFQNCMTCGPYAGFASVYNLPLTIQTIYSGLKKNGIFINTKGCYYDGNGNNVRNILTGVLEYIKTIPSLAKESPHPIEVWRKN
jgi:hypothetical protein